MLKFSEWLPDQPDLENPGATTALNVVPGLMGYRPFYNINPLSTALVGDCRGAFSGADRNGSTKVFAGDDSSLYTLTDTTFSDISYSATATSGYSLGAEHSWEFTQYGDYVVAVAPSDEVQAIDLTSGTFSPLIVSTTKPRGAHCDVVRNFLVLGNITDGSTRRPQRVQWSAFDNINDFDPDVSTQADFQELVGNGGAIQRVVGGEVGLIFQERSIWRMSYTGTPLIFQFDEIITNHGTIAPRSVIKHQQFAYYLAEDGFYRINTLGGGPESIGKNRVDETFFEDLDPQFIYRMSAAIDSSQNLVLWAYPGAANNNGLPNKILAYNWAVNRWSLIDMETELLFKSLSVGYTLDSLDSISTSIDDFPASFDSSLWAGGSSEIAAFNSDHKLSYFTGEALDGVIETAEAQLIPGQRTIVSAVRPYVDGVSASVSVQISGRNLLSEEISWGASLALNAIGEAPARVNARYIRFRVNTFGDFGDAQGIDVTAVPGGKR